MSDDVRLRIGVLGAARIVPMAMIRPARAVPEAWVDRFMRAELRFPDGQTGRIVCSLFSRILFRSRVVVRGDRGELRVSGPFHPQLFHRFKVHADGATRLERFPGEGTFTHQLRAFVQTVCGQATMKTDAVDAIANMRAIDAIYEKAGLRSRGT